MKQFLLLTFSILFLASCWMTQVENMKKIEDCKQLWFWYSLNIYDEVYCIDTLNGYKEDKVMNCIKEYTNWIDEKYHNPDTVSNLREDDYSNVVKTCKEIFWE